jgi:hypothetical protein
MTNWKLEPFEYLEWQDGSLDVIYSNEDGDIEWKPASQFQIDAYKKHKDWEAAGSPDITISLNSLFRN